MKRVSCRHRHFSWFRPLSIGTLRVFCASCGKWEEEIKAKKATEEIRSLHRMLGCRRINSTRDCEPGCRSKCVG